jgi:CheY-like chemotaxis protein
MGKISLLFLVDDDPIYVFTSRKSLEKTGWFEEIRVFGDGKSAFDELSNRLKEKAPLPEVIFLDLSMPVWDGWDFLDEFQALNPPAGIRIYIVSSSNYPEDLERANAYSRIAGYFTKPLSETYLSQVVAET